MREGVKARNMANERANPRHYVLSLQKEEERERERIKKDGIASLPPPLSLSLFVFLLLSVSLSLRKFCLLGNTTGTPSSASSGTPRDTRVTCYLLVDRCRQPTRVESAKCPHQPTCTHDRLCRARGQACDNSVAPSDRHASDVSRDEASTDRRFY